MDDRATERAPSISSSITEAEAYSENEKIESRNSTDQGFIKLISPESLDLADDVEKAELLPAEDEKPPQPKPESSVRTAFSWMVVNTLATIGIVSSRIEK
jgi:solute carrier family 35 protein E3